MPDETPELLSLTADIVSAHVGNNLVGVSDLPTLIGGVYAALSSLGAAPAPPAAKQEPAVSIRASIKPEYLVCLEDGKKMKLLKRHLMIHHRMTPNAYRAKWNLSSDYPMVAPDYAARRRALAIEAGLGMKREPVPHAVTSAPAAVDASAKPKRARPGDLIATGHAAAAAPEPKPARRRKPGIAAT